MKKNIALIFTVALLAFRLADASAAGDWKKTLEQTYSITSTNPVQTNEISYFYDDLNNLVHEIRSINDNIRYIYKYDSSNQLTQEIRMDYDVVKDVWKGYGVDEYTYENGRVKTFKRKKYDNEGVLQDPVAYTFYSYDASGNLTREEARSVSTDNVIDYTEHLYENGHKVRSKGYDLNSVLAIDITYTYNADGTLAEMLEKGINVHTNMLVEKNKKVYTYTKGVLTEMIRYDAQISGDVVQTINWNPEVRFTYACDSTTLVTTTTEFDKKANSGVFEGWEEVKRTVTTHSDKLGGDKTPSSLTAQPGAKGVQLMWMSPMNARAGLSHYKIYRNYHPLTTIKTSSERMTYTDPYVKAGVEYEYFVQAVYSDTLMMNITDVAKAKAIQVAPAITVSEAGPLEFSSKVGATDVKTIQVESRGLTTLSACVMGEGGGHFTLSPATLTANAPNIPLKITFIPHLDGNFTERVAVYSGTDTVFVALQGTATAEGDILPLDVANPLASLNEHFDATTSDKVFQMDGWKNLAVTGARVWRGYNLRIAGVSEPSVRATAYYSTEPGAPRHDMWLVSPALNYKGAASKTLTFRVLGDQLKEGQDASLEVCLLSMKGETPDTIRLDVTMPSTPAENKEWKEYHLNLEGREVADVFFVGFHFQGTGGKANPTAYYIDDVSFGLTALGSVTPSKTSLEMKTNAGVQVTSDAVQVGVQNLSVPVTLSLGGADAGSFTLSATTLPVEGGSFTVSFLSTEVKTHQAQIKVSSRGAADTYITLSANNQPSDIARVTFTEDTDVSVFDASGRQVLHKTICGEINQLSEILPEGIYILCTSKGNFKLAVGKR